jgi:hypothetical protein
MPTWECRIVRDYRPQYAEPISVARDEYVVVHLEDAEYPGWWWCTAPDGRSGWMPVDLLEPPVMAGAQARVVDDYSAIELVVTADESVEVLEEWGGWLFVRNEQGARGWIPATVAV